MREDGRLQSVNPRSMKLREIWGGLPGSTRRASLWKLVPNNCGLPHASEGKELVLIVHESTNDADSKFPGGIGKEF